MFSVMPSNSNLQQSKLVLTHVVPCLQSLMKRLGIRSLVALHLQAIQSKFKMMVHLPSLKLRSIKQSNRTLRKLQSVSLMLDQLPLLVVLTSDARKMETQKKAQDQHAMKACAAVMHLIQLMLTKSSLHHKSLRTLR